MSKRSIQCLDILNLEQIQMLSEKSLLNFFSEMTCNEMTRNFTYQCFLIPDKCCERFTSFGNEAKAKLQIRQHLADHIQQLLDEANGMLYYICVSVCMCVLSVCFTAV